MNDRHPDITIVRRLKAPPEKVYAAITRPDQVLQWWGPDAGPAVSAEIDLRPGGRYNVVFRLMDGSEHNPTGVYQEVVANEKLVFTWEWPDRPDWTSQVTILLRPIDIGTELTLKHEKLPGDEAIDSHRAGWTGWVGELQTFLEDKKMSELIVWTYDWVPEGPRGFVRDIRLRWACEEAGLPYQVASTSFEDRGEEHFKHQPFGQAPWLTDGDLSIFESGAGLLHLARKSEKLMPRDPVGETQTLQWTIAALNSVEMVSVPWWFLEVTGAKDNGLSSWLESRLDHIERILSEREWLAADRFTVADLLMADVLRVEKVRAFGERPASESYVTRITERPAFKKAHSEQMAHFAKAD